MLSILPAASIVVDDSDDVVRANPAAYRLGIVNDDVIVDSRVLDAVRKVREHGGKTSLEITTSTPKRFALPEPVDAEEDLKTSTVSRPNWLKLVIGRIDEQFVVVLIDDISESVRFSQMRDDFVTNVSEMIIRPSEDLQRLADVLEHGGMSPEQVAQAARDVRRSSAYVDHMVKDLLLLIKAQGDARTRNPRCWMCENKWRWRSTNSCRKPVNAASRCPSPARASRKCAATPRRFVRRSASSSTTPSNTRPTTRT